MRGEPSLVKGPFRKAWLHTAVPHILQNGLECPQSMAYSAINKAIEEQKEKEKINIKLNYPGIKLVSSG